MAEFSNPASYELWMGRWSRRLAPSFVAFADLPEGTHLLDLGCGTGVLSLAVLENVEDSDVIGVDPAEAYISYCRDMISNERLCFEVGDALDIPFNNNSFDATASLLILQELPDTELALKEMLRVTRPGGLIVASQWDFANGMPMLRLFWNTVLEVSPSEASRDAAEKCMDVDYPDETALQDLWQRAGLVESSTKRLKVEMEFDSFDDYWTPFLSNATPASSFARTLEPDEIFEIRERLRKKINREKMERSFCLSSFAWAVRGKVPSK